MITIEQLQEKYIQDLLRDINAEGLPEAEQQEIIDLVVERFNKIIIMTLVKLLNNNQRERLEQVIGQPDKLELIIEELAAEVPDLHKLLEQVLLDEYETLKIEMA